MNRLLWQTRRAPLDLTEHGAIMGILNVTPDSFSDGGAYDSPYCAITHALAMERDGARIIDVGGESTRPGAEPVAADEEARRVIPVIEGLRAQSGVLISIDTSKASVAHAAMEAGADIVNDVTGLSGDPRMEGVVRDTGAGVILMHMRGTPRTMQQWTGYADVVAEVREFLRQQMESAIASGIDPMRIVLDPGIGFAKTPEQNFLLLRDCDRLSIDHRPIAIGVSRKSFLGRFAESPNHPDRFWPGVALTSLCRQLGARIFRVHDPRPPLRSAAHDGSHSQPGRGMTAAWEFIRNNWASAIEILILTTVLYYVYKYLRGTRGARILIGLALIFITLTLISQLLDLVVIGWLLRSFSVFLAIALVVIFQPVLRRALTELGSHRFFGSAFESREAIEEITDCVFSLSGKGFGALIAIEREINLRSLIETGVRVDCDFSEELILTIFHPKTVLHDGGLIISNDRIVAAGCIFPLTQREDLDRTLGLRHRAALGLSEESDALAIVVSEETGQVSICHNGIIERNLNVEDFRRQLSRLLLFENNEDRSNADEPLEA